MKTKLFALLLLALLLGFAACSSPPKQVQPQARVSADATLKLAQNLEQKQRWLDSTQSYRSAIAQYQAFGEIRGQLYALAGLARIALQNEDSSGFHLHRLRMQELVEKADPPAKYILDLLDIYVLEREGDYARIMDVAADAYDYPIHIRMQMLSHRLQAESYTNPGYASESFVDLQRLSARYRKSLKKDFSADPVVLANAEYAMAYHSYLLRQYDTALQLIERAIDLDYRYENFGGLGSGYWLRGKIQGTMGNSSSALADFMKARDIFSHFQNPRMQEQVNAAISGLKGDYR